MRSARTALGVALVLLWLALFGFSYRDLLLCSEAGSTSGGTAPAGSVCEPVVSVYLAAVTMGALTVLALRRPLMDFFGRHPRGSQ